MVLCRQHITPSYLIITEICTGPDLGCLHGGYADPKNCAACRCIAGLGGTTCDSVDVTSSAGKVCCYHTEMMTCNLHNVKL